MSKHFPCDKCGACCKQVNLSKATSSLDRGDGTCRHLDTTTNLCAIFNERPNICRVAWQYKNNYADLCSWIEFVNLNIDACKELKANIDKQP
ncbi:YkgJ family cysteine cluster protein [Neptuniibacter sp. QD48_11]|uniref:YkgJ family cysteine cluster protein n=1 Tax=Neptuniibacter sp. QD48_11 TaxID=3398211 RepID=UPI0039F6044D